MHKRDHTQKEREELVGIKTRIYSRVLLVKIYLLLSHLLKAQNRSHRKGKRGNIRDKDTHMACLAGQKLLAAAISL